ncbi:MAG TPA: hypothetical protein VKR42_06315 [Ktedonobacteraceae bacterium]|nr:hypothetical protein [Ktedonobacteraceae bacterium]
MSSPVSTGNKVESSVYYSSNIEEKTGTSLRLVPLGAINRAPTRRSDVEIGSKVESGVNREHCLNSTGKLPIL